MTLTNKELYNVVGGGYGWIAVLGAAITFLIGMVDGIIRPLKCN